MSCKRQIKAQGTWVVVSMLEPDTFEALAGDSRVRGYLDPKTGLLLAGELSVPAGVVISVGPGVETVRPGERVVLIVDHNERTTFEGMRLQWVQLGKPGPFQSSNVIAARLDEDDVPRALGSRVIVRAEPTLYEGLIHVPGPVDDSDLVWGRVTSAGPQAEVEVGSRVLYHRWGGYQFRLDGSRWISLLDSDLWAAE